LLSSERGIVARSHLGVRIIARIGEFVGSTDWIEEFYRLIRACSDYQLGLGEVTNIDDRRIVRSDSFVEGHVPRWSRLEELDQVSLDIPDENFKRMARLTSCMVLLVSILLALLKFVGSWNRGI
jgi:hypothetical protein